MGIPPGRDGAVAGLTPGSRGEGIVNGSLHRCAEVWLEGVNLA